MPLIFIKQHCPTETPGDKLSEGGSVDKFQNKQLPFGCGV